MCDDDAYDYSKNRIFYELELITKDENDKMHAKIKGYASRT